MGSLIGRSTCNATLSDGTTLTPFVFEGLVARVPGIVQYQFIQIEPDAFDLLVVALPGSTDATREALRDLDERLARSTGRTAHFTVRFVDDIPLRASGKHLFVIPLGRC